MKISDKLLVEQAWSLRVNLCRCLETEYLGRAARLTPSIRKKRLKYAHVRAYSRYLRRLKKLWA